MNSNFKLYDVVALLADLPKHNLLRGQVGTIIYIHNDGEAFEVEFVDRSGSTYGLLTLCPEQILVLRFEPFEQFSASNAI